MLARRPRLKSHHGCQMCKRRKKKCDERKPVCSACERLDLKCYWTAESPPQTEPPGEPIEKLDDQVKGTTIVHNPRVRIDIADFNRLSFFYSRTLPLLSKSSPTIAWDGILSSLTTANDAFRNIAAAIASQQRAIDEPALTEIAYHHALSLWRREVSTADVSSAPFLILGCLLFIVMEMLRGDRASQVVHLRNAFRIVNLAIRDRATMTQIKPFLAVLQSLSTSTMLYDQSAKGPHNHRAIKDIRFSPELGLMMQEENDDQFEVNWLIAEWFNARHGKPPLGKSADNSSYLDFLQLRSKNLRARLDTLTFTDANDMVSMITHAKSIILSVKMGATTDRISDFDQVLDIVEQTLELTRIGDETAPFLIGLDLINALEVIITGSADGALRRRALALLSQCPAREGLWELEETMEACAELYCDDSIARWDADRQ